MVTITSPRFFMKKLSLFSPFYAFFGSFLHPVRDKNITKSKKSRKNRYVLESFFLYQQDNKSTRQNLAESRKTQRIFGNVSQSRNERSEYIRSLIILRSFLSTINFKPLLHLSPLVTLHLIN